MSEWVEYGDKQQIRSEGDTTLTIENMGGYWRWAIQKGGKYICDDEVGEYAHSDKEAKILAEFYAI